MYRLRFDKSNGDIFYLDVAHRILCNLDPISEIDVNIASSQGVGQIGVEIENRSVEGLEREITGHIIGYANNIKENMLNVFSPFSEGRLYFNDKFYCDCVVRSTPVIGSATRDVGFHIVLFCAYPFWLEDNKITADMKTYTPCFFFPDPTSGLNQEYHGFDTHIFAVKNEATFFNIYNESEVNTRFKVTFYTTDAIVSNYGIINARTLERLKINDTLYLYEKVVIYWDGSQLRVEKTDQDGNVTDIFSLLDEDSDLFWLHQGDNIIQAFAETEDFPDVSIEYQNTYAGVYDGK